MRVQSRSVLLSTGASTFIIRRREGSCGGARPGSEDHSPGSQSILHGRVELSLPRSDSNVSDESCYVIDIGAFALGRSHDHHYLVWELCIPRLTHHVCACLHPAFPALPLSPRSVCHGRTTLRHNTISHVPRPPPQSTVPRLG